MDTRIPTTFRTTTNAPSPFATPVAAESVAPNLRPGLAAASAPRIDTASRVSRLRLRRAGLVLTNVLSPPVLSAATAAALALPAGTAARPALATYLLCSVAAPLGVLAWLVRRGTVADMDVVRREQRALPMAVMLAGLVLGWQLAVALGAPPALRVMAGAQCVLGLVLLTVTTFWKISVHGAQAAAAAVLLSTMIPTSWPLAALVVLVAATRILLRRHTPAQTVAGVAAGLAVTAWLVRFP